MRHDRATRELDTLIKMQKENKELAKSEPVATGMEVDASDAKKERQEAEARVTQAKVELEDLRKKAEKRRLEETTEPDDRGKRRAGGQVDVAHVSGGSDEELASVSEAERDERYGREEGVGKGGKLTFERGYKLLHEAEYTPKPNAQKTLYLLSDSGGGKGVQGAGVAMSVGKITKRGLKRLPKQWESIGAYTLKSDGSVYDYEKLKDDLPQLAKAGYVMLENAKGQRTVLYFAPDAAQAKQRLQEKLANLLQQTK